MDTAQAAEPALRKPIRLWPGLAAVALQWLVWFAVPRVFPEALMYCMFGGLVAALAILVWWMFFSRAPWVERVGAIVLMVVAAAVAARFIDRSIATAMMGFMYPMFSVPTLCLALVAGAVLGHRLPAGPRRATMAATILVAAAGWTLMRTNGISGGAGADFAWRWSKTSEERLLAQSGVEAAALPGALPAGSAALPAAPGASPSTPGAAAPLAKTAVATSAPEGETPAPVKTPSEPPVAHPSKIEPAALHSAPVASNTGASWPGFRGPGRDSIIPDLKIETDWSASPPVELWRRPIGPGWGSFAVRGDLLYTQEQRGAEEIVSCYNAATGKPVWAHHDATRFWEANAGPGPRATPTLHDGRVYTFGATGIVNALSAADGAVIWSRNAGTDAGMKVPGWGFASSPLVVGDLVVVAASGKLVAYDAATGSPRWFGPAGGDSYSSPQLSTIDGVSQILLNSAPGVTSVSPADGSLLWKYGWPSDTRIMQPAVMGDGDVVISAGDAMGGVGIRRIAVAHGPNGWTTELRWTSAGLKPGFNDFVIYDGHVFGFDGAIMACIDVQDGKRKWKGGRYGYGQLVLLRDQGVLLVVTEEGGLALVRAATDQFTELARFPAIEGKTWNHPVLAGDRLLVRNGDEMAAFRLSLARR